MEVKQSKKWPNYGCTKDGVVYRLSTMRKMSIRPMGGIGEDQYLCFRACHNNTPENVYLHVFVADCWLVNDDPDNKTQVNHKDGNKLNYSLDNLEWVTVAQNRHDAYRTGLDPKGEERYNASLQDSQVHLICQMLQQGYRIVDIAAMFDVTKDAVRKIRAGDTYFHIRVLYDIEHKYKNDLSEGSVRWVCERINEGLSDVNISKASKNPDVITPIEVKRIRHKIRYREVSQEYF